MALQIVPNTVPRAEDYPLDGPLLDALWEMENGHFWHRARNRWIRRALKGRGITPGASLLEVGCGAGAVTRALYRAGYTMVGVARRSDSWSPMSPRWSQPPSDHSRVSASSTSSSTSTTRRRS